MSMWCMMASPLAMTNDLRKVSEDDRRILLNPEIIAINQDVLGKAAERKVMNDNYQIFVRPLADGSHAVALLNTSEKPLTLTADFASLGFAGKYTVRDVCDKEIKRDIDEKRLVVSLLLATNLFLCSSFMFHHSGSIVLQ